MGTEAVIRQAHTLLTASLQIQPGEALAVVSDGRGSADLGDALCIVGRELGAVAVQVHYEPLTNYSQKEYCWFAGRSLRPPLEVPKVLLAALRSADAVVLLTSDLELMFSPQFIEIHRERVNRGIVLPYLDTPSVRRLLPTSGDEVEAVRSQTLFYGEIFARSTHARVTSPAGTDVRLRIGQWETRCHDGVPEQGGFQVTPAGQVAVVPDATSTEGTVVIDRTIADNDYRELHEPITLRVEGGKVVSVEGGVQARLVREFLQSTNDERAFHLTELGIGTNPVCRMRGINGPTEDTHAAGVVSFALGCDTHIGGDTPGPLHIDMTMHFATLVLDETVVVRDGRLVAQDSADVS